MTAQRFTARVGKKPYELTEQEWPSLVDEQGANRTAGR